MNRIKFEVEGVKYAVRKPKADETVKGQAVFNKKFNEALMSGALLRMKVVDVMTKQGLWTTEMDEEARNLELVIQRHRDALELGGIKKSEARKYAIEVRINLNRLNYINRRKNELDRLTAESQAEQARFEYYVSACTIKGDKDEPVYVNLEDYLEKSKDPNDELSFQASMKMMYLLADVDPDSETATPENKFLREFGFVDDKLRLIDKNNKLIDAEGKHIDEEGRYVKWNDELTESTFVDIDGNPVEADGAPPKKEKKPFLDD